MKIDNIILRIILRYTLIISSIVIIIGVFSLFQFLTTGQLNEILLLTFVLLIGLTCFVLTIHILNNKYTKLSFIFVLIYWTAQTVLFGFKGNTYCFTTGPAFVIYFKYISGIEWDYMFRFWSQEFTIGINLASDKIYLGFNLIPLMVSLALIYLGKPLIFSDFQENKSQSFK